MRTLPGYTGATVLFTLVQGLLAMATAAAPKRRDAVETHLARDP